MQRILRPIKEIYSKFSRRYKKMKADYRRWVRQNKRRRNFVIVTLPSSEETLALQQAYRNIRRYYRLGYRVIVIPWMSEKERIECLSRLSLLEMRLGW